MKNFLISGIDLAGVSHCPSGWCLLKGLKAKTALLYSDEEILTLVRRQKPELVAIDAPLTLPPGRKSIIQKSRFHLRPCDEELKRRRIPFFPITLGPMRSLTERGMRLRRILEGEGFRVIEVYPGGAQDIWKIPRVKHNLSGLRKGLKRLGILRLSRDTTGHELDAVTAALVGLLFLQDRAEVYGNFAQGAIIMPPSIRSS